MSSQFVNRSYRRSFSSMGRIAALALGLVNVAATTACTAPEDSAAFDSDEAALDYAPPPHPMDATVFHNELRNNLLPLAKGYAATAGRGGVIYAESAGGAARQSGGGGIQFISPMRTDTPSNVGSVAKYFSGVALMHFFQQRQEKTLDQWLDTPFIQLLPAPWINNVHASLEDVTVRQVLQHKSGIRAASEDPFSMLENGVDPADIGVRSYRNLNYKLLTYFIPVLADAGLKGGIDGYAAQYGNETSRLLLGVLYHYRMMNDFLQALPVSISPSCRPTTEYTNINYARGFASKADTSTGAVWDSWEREVGCRAQGGWYFSARDLTMLGMSIHDSDAVVDQQVRDAMWDPLNSGDRMVFAGFESGTWLNDAFGVSRAPHHNGAHGWDGVRTEAVIMLMPDNTVLSVMVNSPVGTALLENTIENAYRASLGL